VSSKVDEKNLDEEILKIKEKLASKIGQRKKKDGIPPPIDDDDFFNSVPAPRTSAPRNSRSTRREEGDEMDIEEPQTIRKRTIEISDDEPPQSKRARTTKPKVAPKSSRARKLTPPTPPTRKTPARAATSRSKKVFFF
jgi:hypothetical protein